MNIWNAIEYSRLSPLFLHTSKLLLSLETSAIMETECKLSSAETPRRFETTPNSFQLSWEKVSEGCIRNWKRSCLKDFHMESFIHQFRYTSNILYYRGSPFIYELPRSGSLSRLNQGYLHYPANIPKLGYDKDNRETIYASVISSEDEYTIRNVSCKPLRPLRRSIYHVEVGLRLYLCFGWKRFCFHSLWGNFRTE